MDRTPAPRRHDAPYRFLVGTTGCAGDIRRHMGSADYSYAFVLEALAPALERLGSWRYLPVPEASLGLAAARAAAEGTRPVHLSLHPPQNAYFSPVVPTVLFPFWEFPEVPCRDFGHNTRQNWVRMCRGAGLVLVACRFTADALRRAGISAPIAVVPVPVPDRAFRVPDWDPSWTWTIPCRHLVWGGPPREQTAEPPAPAAPPPAPRVGLKRRVARRLKGVYHRRVAPWLSEPTRQRLRRAKRRMLRQADPPLPLLPSTPLSLSGLVYTSLFNLADRRKNPRDLLSAFLIAFRERPDVTLVLKLATSATREYHELIELDALYRSLRIDHACRVVVLTDFLTDDGLDGLNRATTYYVNTSKAEGACLPLLRALAGGRPAIAPRHTAMLDYFDGDIGYVVRSDPEPTHWPHDPEFRHETTWHRLVWSDLRDAFLASAEVAERDRAAYDAMSAAARRRMRDLVSVDAATEALRQALAQIDAPPVGALGWDERDADRDEAKARVA
jgi:glycosyltransferase involved in cell wall biosynthesis